MTTTWTKLTQSISNWTHGNISPNLNLLQESGDKLLQENSSKILLEQYGDTTWSKQTSHSASWSYQTKN